MNLARRVEDRDDEVFDRADRERDAHRAADFRECAQQRRAARRTCFRRGVDFLQRIPRLENVGRNLFPHPLTLLDPSIKCGEQSPGLCVGELRRPADFIDRSGDVVGFLFEPRAVERRGELLHAGGRHFDLALAFGEVLLQLLQIRSDPDQHLGGGTSHQLTPNPTTSSAS
ncbi:MAG TPA: hypothetical protein VN654_05220 [Vicinamibacterales bacterium]|nr:hypothetical protein [Vicinamibacterales bacterium]